MTDNEIIKAMQCVIGNDVSCSECAYQKALPFPSCRRMCAKNAHDLINRKDTQIKNLKGELKAMRGAANSYKMAYEKLKKTPYEMQVEVSDKIEKQIKSGAIKEFAERLCKGRVGNDPVVIATKAELDYVLGVGLKVQE